jgi:hypothetical protein
MLVVQSQKSSIWVARSVHETKRNLKMSVKTYLMFVSRTSNFAVCLTLRESPSVKLQIVGNELYCVRSYIESVMMKNKNHTALCLTLRRKLSNLATLKIDGRTILSNASLSRKMKDFPFSLHVMICL